MARSSMLTISRALVSGTRADANMRPSPDVPDVTEPADLFAG